MADPVTTADVRVATGGWWLFLIVGVLSVIAGVLIILFKRAKACQRWP